jgi:hypothetical protein
MAQIQLYFDSATRLKRHNRTRALQVIRESLSNRRNALTPPRIYSLQLPKTEIIRGCYGNMQLPGEPAQVVDAP